MQLDLAALARPVGEREGTALAVVEQDVDVLACAEIQRLALGQLQQYAHHILGQTFHLGHGGGVHGGFLVLGTRETFDINDHVALGHGTAHECLALGLLGVRQGAALVGALLDAALFDTANAQATAAVAAFVRQGQALAQTGVQNGFALAHLEFGARTVCAMHHHLVRALVATTELRRPPGQQGQQHRSTHHQRPHAAHGPVGDQREQGQVEPVQLHLRDCLGQVAHTPLAVHRGHQREHQKGQQHANDDGARRRGACLGHTLHVDPHDHQQHQRNAQVHEGQQREEAVAHMVGIQEVAHQRAVEDRQPIQPFKAGDGDVLRQLVPGQHVAIDAGGIDHPDQHDARDPREPAEAVVQVEGEVAQHVQHHGQHHGIRGIAVHAAHDAAGPPLVVGQGNHG
jgi:hypothetical protein